MLRLAECDHCRQMSGWHIEDARLVIESGASPIASSICPGHENGSLGSVLAPEQYGRRIQRAVSILAENLERFGLQLRREVDDIAFRHALLIEGRRAGWKWLRWRIPLAGHVAFWNRPFFDWPDRLTRDAIEHVNERLLR